ncbi:MAG: hypothetical protein ICV78_16210 [Tolypothrix sp. Co-bin9]|nr:hypothetical protein [Tolypothrix sp. Co-bin9]
MPIIEDFPTTLLLILFLPTIEIWELLNINPNLDTQTLWTYLHTPLDNECDRFKLSPICSAWERGTRNEKALFWFTTVLNH